MNLWNYELWIIVREGAIDRETEGEREGGREKDRERQIDTGDR